jgi:hypothetical protein
VPGFIKVAGEQKPVAAPYVKVAGEWKPVALGYTKVAGEWKIWHTAEILDNFNRANNANLGLASNNFSQWTEFSGNWAIQSNQAFHDSAAGPSIASTPLFKANTDYKISMDIASGTGLGISFWVQDANNWFAAIPGSRQQDNPSFYSCPSGFTLQGTNCQRTESVPTLFEGPSFSVPQSVPVYSYSCSSGTLQGTNCVTTVSQGAAPATQGPSTFTCPSGSTGPSATNRCRRSLPCTTSTTTQNLGPLLFLDCQQAGGSYSPAGRAAPASCTVTRTTTTCPPDEIFFATETPGSITYGPCPAGQTLDFNECFTITTTPAQQTQTGSQLVCPSGCPPTQNSGVTQCRCPGRGTYCASGVTPTGDQCITTFNQPASFTPASTSYPSVIRIFSNVSGTITQVFTRDVSSDARSMEVSTLGANVVVSLFSAIGLAGSTIASVSYNSGSSLRTRNIGLAKNGNQVQRQGTAIDNFRAE